MTMKEAIARRTFDFEDQAQFAVASGDRNPIHLDPIVARRTQAGAPIVHGVHLLLWALDALAAHAARDRVRFELPPVRTINAHFNKFAYVGEMAEVSVDSESPNASHLIVAADRMSLAHIVVEFGSPTLAASTRHEAFPAMEVPHSPLDLPFDLIAGLSGRLPFASAPAIIANQFPQATRWLGEGRVAALAASSNLVGMVCPGLHSIYSSLKATCTDGCSPTGELGFKVESTDRRFHHLRLFISGAGIEGTIESFSRTPPARQVSMATLATSVARDEFAGSVALVVGGSRGIGELTAKLIATGGGRVIITYVMGLAEAQRVAEEINTSGGTCEVIEYDARKPAAAQLSGFLQAPTHMYYFATPPISGRQSDTFSRRKLDAFLEVYVDGFWDLVRTLSEECRELSVFYPSSVFVEKRPRGMTEYAMAKAAGETLCADLNRSLAPLCITVARLPRVDTDQTATFMPVESSSVLETMLPLIREVQKQNQASAVRK